MARRDPTVGGALVEGVVLPPHPPFYSHALCIDHTSRTGPPVGVWSVLGRCGGQGTDGVQNRRRSCLVCITPTAPLKHPPHPRRLASARGVVDSEDMGVKGRGGRQNNPLNQRPTYGRVATRHSPPPQNQVASAQCEW